MAERSWGAVLDLMDEIRVMDPDIHEELIARPARDAMRREDAMILERARVLAQRELLRGRR